LSCSPLWQSVPPMHTGMCSVFGRSDQNRLRIRPIRRRPSGVSPKRPAPEERHDPMTVSCKNHPTQPAHWQCGNCLDTICPECIDRREKGYQFPDQFLYFCSKCNKEARWLGAGNIIDPFWKRLPRFFAYPLHPRPLILLGVFCAITTIGMLTPGLFSLLLMLMSYCMMLLYSFAALKQTAQGNLNPPPLNQSTLSDDFGLVLKQVGIYVIIGVALLFTVSKLGIFFGIIVFVVALLGLPAMVILLVTTGSLIQAVNPMLFIPLALRIGWGYMLMYLFLILLGGAPQALAGQIASVVPAGVMPLLSTAAKFYYMLISYHMMGYVLMQYHMEIGYTIDQEDFIESEASAGQPVATGGDDKALKDVSLMLRSGEVEDAIDHIQAFLQNQTMKSMELSQLYLKMLKLKKRSKLLVAHLSVHLGILAGENQKSEALALYLSPLFKKKGGSLPAETRFKIAGWLNEKGKDQEALGVLQEIIDEDKQLALIPKAHFRMAQILNDRMLEPGKANAILEDAILKYPESTIIDQMRAYKTHL